MNIALLLGLDFFEVVVVAFLYFAGADRPYLGELEQESKITITLHVGADSSWDPVPLSFYNNASSVPVHKAGDAPRDALAYMRISYNA